MRCSSCGAPITDNSRFCSHCGAKIDDGVKRTEVTINKHIEDVAEIKRAGYEEKESELRQKKAGRELKAWSIKRISILSLIGLNVILFLCTFFAEPQIQILSIFPIFIGSGMIIYMLYLMITGKW